MKYLLLLILSLTISHSFSQEDKEKKALLATKKANNYIAEANDLASSDDFALAEVEYRKAISKQPTTVAGAYNLGHSYFKKGNFEEALYRHEQAAKNATDKLEKHKAYHNIGNILMENKKCKEAVEAYKNALRNNPQDEETRYNFAIAKECAKKQEEENKNNKDEDENSDEEEKKEENKDDQKNEDQKEDQDNKDEQDENDKNEGEDEKDEEGKPKDDKKEDGKQGEDEKKQPQQPKPQPGQMSPQQIKNLLEDMENQEQKVQEKVNAQKAKGVKLQTDKDW
ncbi:tetratricopeptide repeat protein [Lacinutrix salivirga]